VKHLVLALALLGVSLSLAACGKKGPPSPPGPADQVIFPRDYPVVPPQAPGQSPPPQWPFGITPSKEQP
jgi:predicted small lipoprotein YifL